MHRIVRCQKVYSLLDLGTGSGILALAGAVMGIRHILAVDKNRLAVSTARKNVRANALSSSVQVKEGDARFFIDQPFDVVTANLPFQVLRDLSTLRGVNNHRFWIVSGINGQQSKILEGLFGEQGYELFSRHVDPPWVTFTVYRACN
jgi:ribosomal protein L11 methyltransferase